MTEREIIVQLVDLIEAWMNGIFKRVGIRWEEDPPALTMAKAYLNRHPAVPLCPTCRGPLRPSHPDWADGWACDRCHTEIHS